jgi:hypothetical protein
MKLIAIIASVVLLLSGCQSLPVSDQYSIVKGYPGNTYGKDEGVTCETDCLVWGDIPGHEDECWQLVVRRGVVEFAIEGINEGEAIKALVLSYEIEDTDNDGRLLIAPVYAQPSAADWNMAWGDIYDGMGWDGHSGDQTRYYGFITKDTNSVILNENALGDFEGAVGMGQGWFAMGFRHQDDLSNETRVTKLTNLQLTVVFEEER